MRLFIDESLSPKLATRLNETGRHDAVHPLHAGLRGRSDNRIVQRCIAEDRVIVVQNARDFRGLVAAIDLHPGLIILPAIDREGTWRLLIRAIEHLEAIGDPMDVMVNSALEIRESGDIELAQLSA